ncbi:lipid A deacylase LpxR family protein [Bradyrhizobium sp.]|uniref:lipid A deacylase LpxR family protein n=1 Tax=Bradyrhizobium sp. TaxID=376 RepID=UPI0025BA7D98|nr:lipid A deacylase LpxR family protein [Bradyrhizobium sp.]
MAAGRLAPLGFVLFVLSCTSVSAQRVIIVEENDVIAKTYNPALGFDQQHDWDYTQGFYAAVAYDDFKKDPIAGSVYDFLSGGIMTAGAPAGAIQQQMQVMFGQSIYTPQRDSDPVHLPGERPFGGWLYTGVSVAQETGRSQLDSFEIQVGAVGGSASLWQAVQGGFHSLIGSGQPQPGNWQLANEPGIVLAWDRRWKIGYDFADGYGIDLIPGLGGAAGNVFTYGEASALLRIGRSLQTTWGPTRIRPSPSGASFFSTGPNDPAWGWDFYVGIAERVVARNIFLDGSTFAWSPSVTKKVFVTDFMAGAEIFSQSGYKLGFSVTQRTPEYTTQSKSDLFGSIEASARF